MMNYAPYKWYAIGALPLIGIINAIILPAHNYSFSWAISLVNITLFSLASLFSSFAINHTQRISGKISFGLLLIFYASFLIVTIWGIVKHVVVQT
jgi:hypothetical protein